MWCVAAAAAAVGVAAALAAVGVPHAAYGAWARRYSGDSPTAPACGGGMCGCVGMACVWGGWGGLEKTMSGHAMHTPSTHQAHTRHMPGRHTSCMWHAHEMHTLAMHTPHQWHTWVPPKPHHKTNATVPQNPKVFWQLGGHDRLGFTESISDFFICLCGNKFLKRKHYEVSARFL